VGGCKFELCVEDDVCDVKMVMVGVNKLVM